MEEEGKTTSDLKKPLRLLYKSFHHSCWLTFLDYVLGCRHYAKYFADVTSLSPHSTSLR